MIDLHSTTAVLGVGLALGILYLVRRDHLYLVDGLFWIAVACAAIVFGFWPGLVDWIAALAGVAYPPSLLMLIALMVLLVRILLNNIAMTKLRRDLRRVNQRMAIMESEAESLQRDEAEIT
jgi:hypothetical protein